MKIHSTSIESQWNGKCRQQPQCKVMQSYQYNNVLWERLILCRISGTLAMKEKKYIFYFCYILYLIKQIFEKCSYVNPISLSEYFSGSIKIFYTMYKE